VQAAVVIVSLLLVSLNMALDNTPKSAFSTRSIGQPSAAVVEAAYVSAVNLTCERLIDACSDDAYVPPETIRCKIRYDRATCSFAIVRYGHASRCRGAFEYVRDGSAQFWVVAHKRNALWSRLIKCQDGF
jgi:hypothetical protein